MGTPTTLPVSIRIAREADAEDVAALTAQLGYDVHASAIRARLSSILARPDHRFWMAEAVDRRIGWLHATISEYVEADPFVVIGGLVVDSDYRRQGVGRLLMEHVEHWAREQRCSAIRLWSSSSRTAAHRFYEGLGYTNIKTQYAFVKLLDSSATLKSFIPLSSRR
jgi:GNAT superfamily N-acetyltransferase